VGNVTAPAFTEDGRQPDKFIPETINLEPGTGHVNKKVYRLNYDLTF
jgi:hypothetical protein